MSNIDLDPDIFDYLKTQAEPFVDTPNTVLRRLLGLQPVDASASNPTAGEARPSQKPTAQRAKKKAASGATRRTRAPSGTLLPEDRYERPLLRALVDAGGQAPYRDVVDAVGRELKESLMAADFENLASGAVRWQSRLQFVRLRLIERGYLDRATPRGIWGVTEAGRTALAEGQDS